MLRAARGAILRGARRNPAWRNPALRGERRVGARRRRGPRRREQLHALALLVRDAVVVGGLARGLAGALGAHGVGVVVDPSSATSLVGATLDYKDGLQEAGFSIDNPNAQRTCGCGSSFS